MSDIAEKSGPYGSSISARMPWLLLYHMLTMYTTSSRPLRAGPARTSACAPSKPTDRSQGAYIPQAVRDARLPADAARPEHWTLVERRQTKAAPELTSVGFRVSLSSHKLEPVADYRGSGSCAGEATGRRISAHLPPTEYQPQLFGNTRSYASSTREDRQASTIIGELLVAIKDELLVAIKEQP